MRKFIVVLVLFTLAIAAIVPVAAQDTTLTFWTTENQPERVERQEAIAAAFMEANPGVTVEVVPVEQNELGQLMTVNLAAGTLPDVMVVPLEFANKWHADGVLDADAATEVIDSLGVDTFSSGGLALTQVDEGLYSAVPSDGWGQLIVYRSDLFEAAGLAAPDSYDNILAAAQTLNDPDNGIVGFCGPNAPDQLYTWQTFEHVALANGATFVTPEGDITWETPEMTEAVEFYVELMQTAGPAEQGWYWDQTRANYFAGNCAMTIWSPFILDEMAGLRDAAFPTCAECEEDPSFIALNSDFVGAFSGYSSDIPAAFGSAFNFGISVDAPDAAKDYVRFQFEEVYLDVLGVAAEGKFPLRLGNADNPSEYIEAWSNLDVGVDRRAPLSDFYSEEDLGIIVSGSEGYSRMGLSVGQAEIANAVSSVFFIQENLVAAINGEISVEEALENIQIETEDLQIELE